MEITSESRYRWHANDNLVLLAILISTDNSFGNGSSDLVVDWVLLIGTSSDEKLVLDVNEMLTLVNNLNVGIGNRVLL